MPPALSDVRGVPSPARPCGWATLVAPEPTLSAWVISPSKASALIELSAAPSELAVCVPVVAAAIVAEAIEVMAPSVSAPAAPQN